MPDNNSNITASMLQAYPPLLHFCTVPISDNNNKLEEVLQRLSAIESLLKSIQFAIGDHILVNGKWVDVNYLPNEDTSIIAKKK